jgi:cell wall-associated NlpC family hydrolase
MRQKLLQRFGVEDKLTQGISDIRRTLAGLPQQYKTIPDELLTSPTPQTREEFEQLNRIRQRGLENLLSGYLQAEDVRMQQLEEARKSALQPPEVREGGALYQWNPDTQKWDKVIEAEQQHKYQSQFNPITGEQIIFDPTTGRNITTYTPFTINGVSSTGGPQAGLRTERHNNPTAFTTDVAKEAGLKLGVDYEIGDPFIGSDGKVYYTARLLKDPIDTTIKVIDKLGFYTATGQPRWAHTAIPKAQWDAMTYDQKRAVIEAMRQKENGTTPITYDEALKEAGKRGITDPKAAAGFAALAVKNQAYPAKTNKPLGQFELLGAIQVQVAKDAIDRVQQLYGNNDTQTRTALYGLLAPWSTEIKTEASRMGSFIQYLLSGKQINETEYQRLMTLMPNVKDILNPAEARRKLRVLKQDLENYMKLFSQGRDIQTGQATDYVLMQSPTGQVGYVPQEDVEEALQEGYIQLTP